MKQKETQQETMSKEKRVVFFEGKSWYVGTQIAEEFDESELSKVEKANVRLIQKYENK